MTRWIVLLIACGFAASEMAFAQSGFSVRARNDFPASAFAQASQTGGIQEAIDACQRDPGTGSSVHFGNKTGCVVTLPRGEVVISSPIVVGSLSSNNDTYAGFTLRGQGAGIRTRSGENVCGTTLVFRGRAATGMGALNLYGIRHALIEDFCLAITGSADFGISIRGSNSSAPAGRIVVQRVSLRGIAGARPNQAALHIGGDGNPAGVQADLVSVRDVNFEDVPRCVVQGIDAEGAVSNVVEQMNCAYTHTGVRLEEGGLHIRDSQFGDLGSSPRHAVFVSGRAEVFFLSHNRFEVDAGEILRLEGQRSDENQRLDAWIAGNAFEYGANGRDAIVLGRKGVVSLMGNSYGSRSRCGRRCWNVRVNRPRAGGDVALNWGDGQPALVNVDFEDTRRVSTQIASPMRTLGGNRCVFADATGWFADDNCDGTRGKSERPLGPGAGAASFGPAFWALPGQSGRAVCASTGLLCAETWDLPRAAAASCQSISSRRLVQCR